MKKGICVGHLIEDKKLRAKAYIQIYDFPQILDKKWNLGWQYKIIIHFNQVLTFEDLKHLLTNEYVRKANYNWECGFLKEQIIPEIERLRSAGFEIIEGQIAAFVAEFV